jgi:DGQHR domain-containing protein
VGKGTGSGNGDHAKEKRRFARSVRTIFDRAGFKRVPAVADVEISFDGRTGDFDDLFVFENVFVFTEYTVGNEKGVKEHIKGKVHLFNKVLGKPTEFAEYIADKFPEAKKAFGGYHLSQAVVKVLYCSKTEVSDEHKGLTPDTYFWHTPTLRYFSNLSSTIKKSSRFEIFDFFKITNSEIGSNGALTPGSTSIKFPGSILPEAHSHFPAGYKVVSFYVSPGAILSRAYVLRKDGWRDSDGLYQRMIRRGKIESIRRHLRKNERVFVNNIIVTLADDTKLLNDAGNEVDPKSISKITPISVQLSETGNSVGIVDGQHRVFSYYESAEDDPKIATYRGQQNLLATGILYPGSVSREERERFEANLFLEINSKQNSAGSSLTQAIAVIVEPFSTDSVAKRTIQRLALKGPLSGILERHYFDTGVLRTTTIVSYGLRRLVRIDGDESIFALWSTTADRAELKKLKDATLLGSYIDFCVFEITKFLEAAKRQFTKEQWRPANKANPSGILNVTVVNGLLICFRLAAKKGGLHGQAYYESKLNGLSAFKFSKYGSSHYNSLGEALFKQFFP